MTRVAIYVIVVAAVERHRIHVALIGKNKAGEASRHVRH